MKNARKLKPVSQAKPPYFERIFKLWTHEQQELPYLQIFIMFAQQNLKNFCVTRPWHGFRFSWKFWCCMLSNPIQKSIKCKALACPCFKATRMRIEIIIHPVPNLLFAALSYLLMVTREQEDLKQRCKVAMIETCSFRNAFLGISKTIEDKTSQFH